MKKLFTSLFITLVSINIMAWEYEMPEFEWSASTDITSSYLWRGMNLGGLSLQPDINISYAGLSADLWFNVGPADWTFADMAPEFDFTISYSIAGLTIGVNHQFYFEEGQKYFDFHQMTTAEFDQEDPALGYNTNLTEVSLEYDFSEVLENVPLTLAWYTFVTGDDCYKDENGNVKQAYSTYISATYDWEALEGFTVSPTIAVTPWKSTYNYYEGNFSVANLALKLDYEKELTDHFSFHVWAEGTMRPFKMNKENLFISPNHETLYHCDQRLNGAIGIGFNFY